jgi:XTP/dITP diphosphohydrolase
VERQAVAQQVVARKLVLASNNAKKLAELRSLLNPIGVELLAQADHNIPETEEPFGTFVENALTKARHAAACSGLAALADDSGLCVDALMGLPGVRSARFAADAGLGNGDDPNNALLLERMQGLADRSARFVCVLVALRHAHDPEPLVATGHWPLQVLQARHGAGGFGYDPVVQAKGFDCSVAELPAAVKNLHSHRALAMRSLLAQLQ